MPYAESCSTTYWLPIICCVFLFLLIIAIIVLLIWFL